MLSNMGIGAAVPSLQIYGGLENVIWYVFSMVADSFLHLFGWVFFFLSSFRLIFFYHSMPVARSYEESGNESDLELPQAGQRDLTCSVDFEEDGESDIASPEKPAPRKNAQPVGRVSRAVVRSSKQQQLGKFSFFVHFITISMLRRVRRKCQQRKNFIAREEAQEGPGFESEE